jgi:hypothetical protein
VTCYLYGSYAPLLVATMHRLPATTVLTPSKKLNILFKRVIYLKQKQAHMLHIQERRKLFLDQNKKGEIA